VEISALAVTAARLNPRLAASQDFARQAIQSECRRLGIGLPAFEAAVTEMSANEKQAERIRQRINARVGELLAAKARPAPPRLPGPEERKLMRKAG